MRRLGRWLRQNGWVGLVLAVVAGLSLITYAPWAATGHDSLYHTANITAMAEAMQDGGSLKVLPEIAKNLGYGSGIFYPQLFHVVAAALANLLSPLTTNLYYSVWLTHWCFLWLSGVFLYILAKKILSSLRQQKNQTRVIPASSQKRKTKNKIIPVCSQKRKDQEKVGFWGKRKIELIAVLTACFYMTATYHLADIIVRDAQAEVLIFTFIPMVVLGLWYLFRQEPSERWKFYPWFILGYTGLFYSHLPLTMYFTILLAIVLVINWRQVFTKRFMGPFWLATAAVILLVLPFLLPMLEQITAAEYAVYANDTMSAGGINFSGFLYDYFSFAGISSGDGFPITLNFVMLALSIVAIIYIKKRSIQLPAKKFVLSLLLVMGVGSVIMMLHIFPWIVMPRIFMMLQFAWRLNVFLIFALSIAAGVGLYLLPVKWQKISLVAGTLFCVVSVMQVNLLENTNKNWHLDYVNLWSNYDYYPEAEVIQAEKAGQDESARSYNGNNYNQSDASLMGMGYQGEYLPVKTWRRWDEAMVIGINQEIKVLSGQATVQVEANQTPTLKIKVSDVDQAKIQLPRLYYVGYQITATYADGQTQKLTYQESELGLIEIAINQDAEIQIEYTGTELDRVADALAGATAVTCLVCIYFARHDANVKYNIDTKRRIKQKAPKALKRKGK